MATKSNLCVHPNPYLLAEVLFDELRSALDDEMASRVGNPNLKSYRNKKLDLLSKKRREQMEKLASGDIDLCTYLKSIGYMSIRFDKKCQDIGKSCQKS